MNNTGPQDHITMPPTQQSTDSSEKLNMMRMARMNDFINDDVEE
jgi:hypothetical protein